MGYIKNKMANIRPKWPELDLIICKNLIKVKKYIIVQNKPIKVKIDILGHGFTF